MDGSPHLKALAIDGGGTRCRLALTQGARVTTVETGPANVSTDFDGAIAQILTGLRTLAAETGESAQALARQPAFIGLAGVTGPEVADRVRGALPFGTARVEDDRPAALRGALGHREGAVAHCGTGSFFGSYLKGAMRLSGGWGPILGDEASAQWIGRRALRGALETVDGEAETSGLSRALLDRLGGAAGIVDFAGTAPPSRFGALAPLVTAAAQEADSLALRTMEAGAAEIAKSLPPIGWRPGIAICLTGGIGPQFAPYLPDAMQADVAPPAGEPLSGALALARELARETAL